MCEEFSVPFLIRASAGLKKMIYTPLSRISSQRQYDLRWWRQKRCLSGRLWRWLWAMLFVQIILYFSKISKCICPLPQLYFQPTNSGPLICDNHLAGVVSATKSLETCAFFPQVFVFVYVSISVFVSVFVSLIAYEFVFESVFEYIFVSAFA